MIRFPTHLAAIGLVMLLLANRVCAEPPVIDLTHAVVVFPTTRYPAEQKAVQMLIEEVEKRSRVPWEPSFAMPAKEEPVIFLGPADTLLKMAREEKLPLPEDLGKGGREGYRIGIDSSRKAP